jgi:phage terminase Nu1 subunit (DNA packaging protein)
LDIEITTAQATELFGVGARRLQQMVAEGVIPKTSRGRYRLVPTVQGVVRGLRNEIHRASRNQAANRVAEARARQIELRVAREAGELCQTSEALEFVDDVLGTMKADLLGFPAQMSGRDRDLQDRIEAGVDQILRRAADRCRARAQELRRAEAGRKPEGDAA